MKTYDLDTSTNIVASRLLDDHHPVDGQSEYGDDTFDVCKTCGCAVGFYVTGEPDPPDYWGHATAGDVADVMSIIVRLNRSLTP